MGFELSSPISLSASLIVTLLSKRKEMIIKTTNVANSISVANKRLMQLAAKGLELCYHFSQQDLKEAYANYLPNIFRVMGSWLKC